MCTQTNRLLLQGAQQETAAYLLLSVLWRSEHSGFHLFMAVCLGIRSFSWFHTELTSYQTGMALQFMGFLKATTQSLFHWLSSVLSVVLMCSSMIVLLVELILVKTEMSAVHSVAVLLASYFYDP